MKLFQNLSLRSKLIIATLIPLLALFYYLQINIRGELANRRSAKQAIVDVALVREISKVIHEFQKERALTSTFLSTNGAKGRDQLAEQRESTDYTIAALQKVF